MILGILEGFIGDIDDFSVVVSMEILQCFFEAYLKRAFHGGKDEDVPDEPEGELSGKFRVVLLCEFFEDMGLHQVFDCLFNGDTFLFRHKSHLMVSS